MPQKKRDVWDKLDILIKPTGALLTAVTVGLIGFFGSSLLEERQLIEAKTQHERQLIEAKTQLYAELMSKREESDTSLRKELLKNIVETFLKPKSPDNIEEKVLALELLAYNFHDSFDLTPVFKHVYKEIINSQAHDMVLGRLKKIANEIIIKQITSLEEGGKKIDGSFDVEELNDNPGGIRIINEDVNGKIFSVEALLFDEEAEELRVKLVVKEKLKEGRYLRVLDKVFWVGLFDFPMIDNTRIPDGKRCAIVLQRLEGSSGQIIFVIFPGDRASLKEKPYYGEVIKELLAER